MDSGSSGITQAMLDSMNVEQARESNKEALIKLGGIEGLAQTMEVSLETGLTHDQVAKMRERFGTNEFPESPMAGFFELLLGALSDTTLLILVAAATVSLVIGILEDPANGWIEGSAIFIAVFLVANISAGNDYSKQLQFRALEASSAQDERTSVLRSGAIERINPKDLVVGDILVLQAGDSIPADAIVCDHRVALSSEAALTGEPDDLKKTRDGDPFLLSSCLITECDESRALVIGIGTHSQWGKIKANLVTEAVNTPLQDKLETMTEQIGYVGMVAAAATFLALVVNIWARHGGANILQGFIEAFILAVTIVVVAIPEGLPLAVTIALAYSTKKMYEDQNFIRVLAACETMGNATNICSDKTGTLTENRMTVVAGWYGDQKCTQDEFSSLVLEEPVKKIIAEHCCVNRVAYLVYKDSEGRDLDRPNIIGNKTEGAMLVLARNWGYDDEEVRRSVFDETKDKVFAFNSNKKRSTTVVHRKDGSVTLFCKGASEWVIKDCTHFMDRSGHIQPMTEAKRADLNTYILSMANQALRTLVVTHKHLASAAELPKNWEENPPDSTDLVLDCILGIIDPLRADVKEAVAIAQRAGVTVRMVTGDNIATASAIARQCGILKDDGIAVEGPDFRNMTPKEVDAILPKLQVMGRSSPDDKYLLVTRLNGHGVPAGKEEWERKHKDKVGVSWEKDRDRLLPGYREEWEATRPEGGQVVGVTGDGTNDAPALKAADVGLAMGITGTKVAQSASDIVILDDKFSSIVRAIMWGRSVYDNIRKFLQFQLTVNLVALVLVFIGAVAGFGEPLNAVQMLWVNLVMDTFGALALATEPPSMKLLERMPYKRSAGLVSKPMLRNIIGIGLYQLIMLLVLMFVGAQLFGVQHGIGCNKYRVLGGKANTWTLTGSDGTQYPNAIQCNDFAMANYCGDSMNMDCLNNKVQTYTASGGATVEFKFGDLKDFSLNCLYCSAPTYVQGSIIFNAFIFCQIFNEYNSRNLFDELNPFRNILSNYVFLGVSAFSLGTQIFLIELGGQFVKTSALTLSQWLITIALGFAVIPLGMLLRFVPAPEDAEDFFDNKAIEAGHKKEAPPNSPKIVPA